MFQHVNIRANFLFSCEYSTIYSPVFQILHHSLSPAYVALLLLSQLLRNLQFLAAIGRVLESDIVY